MSNNRFAQKKRISLSFLRIPYLLFPAILIVFLLALSSIQDSALQKQQESLETALERGHHPLLCCRGLLSTKPFLY